MVEYHALYILNCSKLGQVAIPGRAFLVGRFLRTHCLHCSSAALCVYGVRSNYGGMSAMSAMNAKFEFGLLCDTPECHETVRSVGQCARCRRDEEEAREAGLGEILDNHVWRNLQAVSRRGTPLSVEAHDHVSRYNRTRAQARQMVPLGRTFPIRTSAKRTAPIVFSIQCGYTRRKRSRGGRRSHGSADRDPGRVRAWPRPVSGAP